MIVVEAVVCTLFALMWIFFYCYFAAKIANNLDLINNIVYNTLWYNYPVDIQRSLIPMMRVSQKPFNFNALNMFDCNLEKFGVVRKDESVGMLNAMF